MSIMNISTCAMICFSFLTIGSAICTDSTPKPTYFGRPLPEICIGFSSERGRQLFKEALLAPAPNNYFQIYFPLAEQFKTQSDTHFCGLGTLAMSFNALKIDPKRVWKASWRWYSEEQFDCCHVPLSVIRTNGTEFSEFVCLAE